MIPNKSRFKPKFPRKYKGDPTNIIARSSLERRLMTYLDNNSAVIEWSSEEHVIPYVSPVDNRYHRYFPDFVVKARDPSGAIKTMMIEIKPEVQTREPKRQKKTKRYLTEVMTWGVNSAKWSAAREYCADRGWEFRIVTEKDLGVKYK